jgi:flagellar hook-length control protein FliK
MEAVDTRPEVIADGAKLTDNGDVAINSKQNIISDFKVSTVRPGVQSHQDHYLFEDYKNNDEIDKVTVPLESNSLINNEVSYSTTTATTSGGNSNTEKIASYTQPLMETISNQIIKSATHTMNNGSHELEIALKPEFLGEMNIKLISSKDGLIAKIKVSKDEVKEILSTQIVQIQEVLKNQGIEMKDVEFTSFDTASNQNQAGSENSKNGLKQNERQQTYFNYADNDDNKPADAVENNKVRYGRVNYLA